MRGRHTNIDDGCVGTRETNMTQQRLGVLGLGDDVNICVAKKAHDSFAREHRVVGDDYSHGISA
jgi:hypothetical protein